ncbi:hypothetical protein [Lampropedia hyalina]|nr:hypothetical protein [Lampropedia hyalina]
MAIKECTNGLYGIIFMPFEHAEHIDEVWLQLLNECLSGVLGYFSAQLIG